MARNIHHLVEDTLGIQTKLVHQRRSLPRLTKAVVHADTTHANGMVFGQKLRHGTA